MPSLREIHQNNIDIIVGITCLQNECCEGYNSHLYVGTPGLKNKTKLNLPPVEPCMLNDYESFSAILVSIALPVTEE